MDAATALIAAVFVLLAIVGLLAARDPDGVRHNHEDPSACPCRPTRVGSSGRDEWIHHPMPRDR